MMRPHLKMAFVGFLCVMMIFSTIGGVNSAVAEELSWEIIQLTDNSFVDEHPVIVVDAEGTIHMAWAGGTYINETLEGNLEIFYAVKTESSAWEISQLTDNEVHDLFPILAVDSNGAAHLTWWSEVPKRSNEIFYATNAEGSWEITTVTQDNTNDVRPSLAVDLGNTPHIAWQRQQGADNWEIFYGKRANESWDIEQVTENLAKSYSPNLVLDPFNTPYIAWWEQSTDKFSSAEIFYGIRTDTGWTTYQVTANSFGDRDPLLVLDSHLAPHIAWTAYIDNNDVYYTTRGCACSPFEPNQVTTQKDPDEEPTLALGSDDTPHLVWERESKIYYAMGSRETGFWQTMQITTGHNPWIVLDHNNKIYIAYFDTPVNKNESEIFLATTKPGVEPPLQTSTPNTTTISSVEEFVPRLESLILVVALIFFLGKKRRKSPPTSTLRT